MDRSRLPELVQSLLVELGGDLSQEQLAEISNRVGSLLEKFTLREPEPMSCRRAAENAGLGHMVVRTFAFFSLCEHHLLPFFGRISVGCVERAHAFDEAYCAHIVERFSHRPQLQERLTEQIGDALMKAFEPEGVAVAAQGRHMCMMMRGVEKQNSSIQTSTLRGCFNISAVRREFFTHAMKAAGS